MDLDRPNNLNKTVDAICSARPVKVAYLVPYEEIENSHLILDAVFYESYTRWGGAYTLLIPTSSDGFPNPLYMSWLEAYDPDFVYSYVDLSEELILSIDHMCSPIAMLRHKIFKGAPEPFQMRTYLNDWHHYFNAVSSVTTVNSPRNFPSFPMNKAMEGEITVLTQYGLKPNNRIFDDNFGSAFTLHNVTHPLPGLYRTLCLVPKDLPENINVGSERCFSMSDVFDALSKRKAVPIANFAMVHSEAIPKPEPYKWSNSFNIFIGDSVLDRINFWNARHLAPNHAQRPGALILDKDFFNDDERVRALGDYLKNTNFIGHGGGPYQATLRSHSLDIDTLKLLQTKLQAKTFNQINVRDNFDAPAIPEKKDFEHIGYRPENNFETLTITEDAGIFLAKEPAHFMYIPPRLRGIAIGQWLIELSISRHNNLSIFSNVTEKWVLPKRRKAASAFTKRFSKVTKEGRLALLPSSDDFPHLDPTFHSPNKFDLTLPSDEEFFRYVVLDFVKQDPDDLRSSINVPAYQALGISDKGRNLRGVISMFESLHEAYGILTNKFWREVIRSANEDSARYLCFSFNELAKFLPNTSEDKQRLMEEMRFNNPGTLQRYMTANLTDSTEHLVRKKVFHQVAQWKCEYCGHTNSRNFDDMKLRNVCDVCKAEYLTPIDLVWNFELNDFVHRSLSKHSGLPVLWTLGYLQDRSSRYSFWYLSEVDLYEKYDTPNSNEIDILCMIDGKFHAIEAKRSASLLLKPGSAEKFVKVVNLLKPDVAMLSFERYCDPERANSEDIKKALIPIFNSIREAINSTISFEVLIATDHGFDDHSFDLGWTGWRSNEVA